MMPTDNEEFMKNLRLKGNQKAKFDKLDYKVTVRIYSNGFTIITPDIKEEASDFFPYEIKENVTLLNDIKQSKFPLSLLKADKKEFESKSFGVIIEDYTKESFLYVNHKEEVTKLTIKLANGNILTMDFNINHTLKEIIECIASDTTTSKDSFKLLCGYPPKEITEFDKTIHQLKLEGGTLIQKLN